MCNLKLSYGIVPTENVLSNGVMSIAVVHRKFVICNNAYIIVGAKVVNHSNEYKSQQQ